MEASMQKIWIVGSLGRIGQALLKLLDVTEYELFATDVDEVDISQETQVTKYMTMNRPDVVINCAGYHDASLAENEKQDADMAYKVNAVGVRNLAQAAQSIGAKLIQLSTDDVFSKPSQEPYNEFDEVAPADIYGKSKYAGERYVRELMTRYVIIRSSWVYGIGDDFLDEVIRAAKDDKAPVLTLKDNASAVPTSAAELARIIKVFIDEDHYGIYHAVCSGGYCTRAEFAQEILKLTGLSDQLRIEVPANATEKYSVLDNMMLRITGLDCPADWRETLEAYLKETGEIE